MKESKHPVVSIEFILTVFMHHVQKWLHGNLEKGLILCGIISKYVSILFILMNGLYIGRVLIFFPYGKHLYTKLIFNQSELISAVRGYCSAILYINGI